MVRKIVGLFFLLAGLAVFAGAIAVEIAWLGICFGTVIIGLLLLFMAPTILLLPVNLGFVTGMAIWGAGMAMITSDGESRSDTLKKFNSLEPGIADSKVAAFINPQLQQIREFGYSQNIDIVVVAYYMALVSMLTKKRLSLADLKPTCHGIYPSRPMDVDNAFHGAITNHAKYSEIYKSIRSHVRDEIKNGQGEFLVRYAQRMTSEAIPF
ncbi:hypothetical protein SAMN05216247_103317 [Pseudomonas salomonii]|uniref:Uncharacterized protein n=2 Tax=Pseudomonas salomonii TaxID=191391 RepID=A0A1H3INL5_9PSED|nr:hypothetical protein SAMN05216247_103317 [Pseudomonas salomonii]